MYVVSLKALLESYISVENKQFLWRKKALLKAYLKWNYKMYKSIQRTCYVGNELNPLVKKKHLKHTALACKEILRFSYKDARLPQQSMRSVVAL